MGWIKSNAPSIAVVVVVVGFAIIARLQIMPSKYQGYDTCTRDAYERALNSIVFDPSAQTDSEPQRADQQPDIAEDIARCSDLAAQWRMADVTERAYWAGVIGLIFLAVTLIQTQKAARSTADALKVAQDTLEITKRTSRAEFQPYISLSELHVPLPETDASAVAELFDGEDRERVFCLKRRKGEINLRPHVKVTNNGKIPAHRLFCLAAAELSWVVPTENGFTTESKHLPSVRIYFSHRLDAGEYRELAIRMRFKTGVNVDYEGVEEVSLHGFRLDVGVRVSWEDEFSVPRRRVVEARFSDKLDGGKFESIGFIETQPKDYDDPEYWNKRNALLPLGIYGPNVMRNLDPKPSGKLET